MERLHGNLGIGSRVKHPDHGVGVIVNATPSVYRITFIEGGLKEIDRNYTGLDVIEAVKTPDNMVALVDLERTLAFLFRKYNSIGEVVPMGDKWIGGKLVLKPGSDDYKEKEIPIDNFFHKIVMVRDRVRVMEQRINGNKKLTDEEKVNLQQYITKIYGSLTTFNVLFKRQEDYFVGERS